ncbi:phosphatidylinositol mannoside acyltransferase [Streptomyces sp. NPDC059740]|uniref:phosphatidylinositol mannoside acyltransferase n=1 Tax=Streptomyces sp. NPDC059740 TaxID=3346926 RepID=UPI00365514D8
MNRTLVTAEQRDRLTDALYGAGWAGVRRLPEPVAGRLGRSLADAAWQRRGKGVRRLEANLARVVPHADEAELHRLSRFAMRSYLRYWMESFRLPSWTPERIAANFAPEGVDHLRKAMAEGRGAVVALPHLANWDLAGAWLSTVLGIPFTTVAERLKPEALYDRFVAYREGLGMEVLPHTGGAAFGKLARRLRSGGAVCLVADRDLSSSGVPVDFFGERASMPAGPAMLALQTGAALLPVTLWYEAPPRMGGRVHAPVEVPQSGTRKEKAAAMTQAVADAFASGIAAHPHDWHMLQRLWLDDLDAPDGAATAPSAAPGSSPAPSGDATSREDAGRTENA